MNEPLVIGLTATRGCGKDTLFARMAAVDDRCVRSAFADPLKAELAPFLLEHFGIDMWSCSAADKETIRPLLIGHGMSRRNQDPLYWVKRTIESIETDMAEIGMAFGRIIIPVVTDVRFENEAVQMRASFPGFRLVNITRKGAPPPTEEEEKHYRQVAAMADLRLDWGDDTEEQQLEHARGVLGRLEVDGLLATMRREWALSPEELREMGA